MKKRNCNCLDRCVELLGLEKYSLLAVSKQDISEATNMLAFWKITDSTEKTMGLNEKIAKIFQKAVGKPAYCPHPKGFIREIKGIPLGCFCSLCDFQPIIGLS